MRFIEEIKQTDNPTVHKKLLGRMKTYADRSCRCCPIESHKKKDLKSWKANRQTQYR